MIKNVKITVNNNTNKVLTLVDQDTRHGKFTSDPPATIEASGSWTCSTREGSLAGTEGTVTYQTDGGNVTIEFYFNHPPTGMRSVYLTRHSPHNSMGSEVKGRLEGHNQDVIFELYQI